VPISELNDWDVHHAADAGHCWGYLCCNPDHLAKREHREHARMSKAENAALSARVSERHSKLVRLLLDSTFDADHRDRQSPDSHGLTGAAQKRRFIGGVPYLIHTGDFVELDEAE
jgi:hypothetical protein